MALNILVDKGLNHGMSIFDFKLLYLAMFFVSCFFFQNGRAKMFLRTLVFLVTPTAKYEALLTHVPIVIGF